MLAGDTPDLRKARGAFFTPEAMCHFVVRWAVRSAHDRVLEPSCGEAAFLTSAGARLQSLGGVPDASALHGVELHRASADHARTLLREGGYDADIAVGDFFETRAEAKYDVCVGNPPYVRFQAFSGRSRKVAAEAALAAGVKMTGLASSWAPFVVHASQLLRPDGRLGLVLPAELLTVNYAAGLRRFLLRRFGRVRLVLFEERVFPDVTEEIVLLLAEGEGPAPHLEVHQARNLDDLGSVDDLTWTTAEHGRDRWMSGLLPADTITLYESKVSTAPWLTQLGAWGDPTLGMVTGNNSWFMLTGDEVRRRKLSPSDLLPMCPPGSRHLRGLSFGTPDWKRLDAAGDRVWLFRPPAEPSPAGNRYIKQGEADGVDEAYKCRVRKPWWRVPLVPVPDIIVTYMNHEAPRLVWNSARLRSVNSVHGVTLAGHAERKLGSLLPMAALNTLTLLGGELVGRSYGGGLLKLEPKEAERLPVPSLALVHKAQADLRKLQPKVRRRLADGALSEAVALVDEVLLTQHLAMSDHDLTTLRSARMSLFSRRASRGAKSK
jgi:adenine-specific DNA-methyltransferase